MIRLARLLILFALLPPLSPVFAADEEPSLEYFYPLVTRRPVVEREVEFTLVHAKGSRGRETDAAIAIEYPVLPRWQIELEVPFVFTDARDSAALGGPGDVEIENKVLLFKSLEHKAQIAGGVEAKLPTGSERRGLGGEAAVEPFITGGIALGDFDILASAASAVNIDAHVQGRREQVLEAGAAVGYRLHRLFTPLLELTTVTRVAGGDDDGRRQRTQVYLIPGFNSRLGPGTTLRSGIQLPVTAARGFDYALHVGLVKEF